MQTWYFSIFSFFFFPSEWGISFRKKEEMVNSCIFFPFFFLFYSSFSIPFLSFFFFFFLPFFVLAVHFYFYVIRFFFFLLLFLSLFFLFYLGSSGHTFPFHRLFFSLFLSFLSVALRLKEERRKEKEWNTAHTPPPPPPRLLLLPLFILILLVLIFLNFLYETKFHIGLFWFSLSPSFLHSFSSQSSWSKGRRREGEKEETDKGRIHRKKNIEGKSGRKIWGNWNRFTCA